MVPESVTSVVHNKATVMTISFQHYACINDLSCNDSIYWPI